MSKTAWKRAGFSLTAVALVAGAAGCGTTKGEGDRSVTQVLTAAFNKTSDAKSAKFKMTITPPAGAAGSGAVEASGVMGWNPTVMDMTVSGAGMGAAAGGPEEMRMVWVKNIMYVDGGAKLAKEMDGKRWMKLDLAAAAELSENKALQKQMTGGLDSMDQDPSKQMALLLDSPNVKRVGEEKIDGVATEHYKGTLTMEEMIASNKSLKVLDKKERDDLIAQMKKAGIKGYDTEVWVNKDDYPVKMDIGIDSAEGKMKLVATYSDYGAKASVQAPPAGETTDLMKLLKEIGEKTKDPSEA
ncbi:hypothetical protein ACWF94_38805 [Streptomyces sp. NPDC055078]